MTPYFDASVVVPLVVAQEHSAAAEALVRRVEPIVISSFVMGEVASAISRLVRMDETSEAEGVSALTTLDVWSRHRARTIESYDADVRLAGTFVRQFDLALRLPDAIHIALVHRLGLTLITFDRRMVAAAQRLGIAVEIPA